MSRRKAYIEEEVIEKAMYTFWKNGYKATSVRMLEKEMGINQFSIYASFKDKDGVFLKSLQFYKNKLRQEVLNKLINSQQGIESVKKYFYDFLEFSKEEDEFKGCLLTNSVFEIEDNDEAASEINEFAIKLRNCFRDKLAMDKKRTKKLLDKQANYLIVALQGLSVASKMLSKEQLDDFIEVTFNSI